MNCTAGCMVCGAEQQYKVNFSKYHGVCQLHLMEGSTEHKCTYCKSNVKAAKISGIYCIHCSSPSNISYSQCIHNICKSCNAKSLQCDPCKIPEIKCENCIKRTKTYVVLDCNHSICKECLIGECPICELTIEKNKGKKSCQYCLKANGDLNEICNHWICKSCKEEDQCPMCSFEKEKEYENTCQKPPIVEETKIVSSNSSSSSSSSSEDFIFSERTDNVPAFIGNIGSKEVLPRGGPVQRKVAKKEEREEDKKENKEKERLISKNTPPIEVNKDLISNSYEIRFERQDIILRRDLTDSDDEINSTDELVKSKKEGNLEISMNSSGEPNKKSIWYYLFCCFCSCCCLPRNKKKKY